MFHINTPLGLYILSCRSFYGSTALQRRHSGHCVVGDPVRFLFYRLHHVHTVVCFLFIFSLLSSGSCSSKSFGPPTTVVLMRRTVTAAGSLRLGNNNTVVLLLPFTIFLASFSSRAHPPLWPPLPLLLVYYVAFVPRYMQPVV